ncbi:MAG: hypothetical protein WC542_14085 [Paludibacter sp.]|jgi:hypothetical protein
MKRTNFLSLIAVIALLTSVSFTSCKPTEPDPNAGKTDPSTIAKTDLVAYFPFNGNGNDSITGMTPTNQPNVTYVTARRKSGYKGVDNAYFLYNLASTSKLKTLKAFAVAMWINEPQIPSEQAPVPMILQIGKDDDLFWGNLALTQDRMGSATAPVDSLNFKMMILKNGAPWNMQWLTPISTPAIKAAKWMHIIFEYDNVSSTFSVYVNGAKLALSDGLAKRFSDAAPATGVQPALGDLAFDKASKMVIGGWMTKVNQTPPATDDWMGWFNGTMDELRIYDRALTATEAKDLYDAEVTQLN